MGLFTDNSIKIVIYRIWSFPVWFFYTNASRSLFIVCWKGKLLGWGGGRISGHPNTKRYVVSWNEHKLKLNKWLYVWFRGSSNLAKCRPLIVCLFVSCSSIICTLFCFTIKRDHSPFYSHSFLFLVPSFFIGWQKWQLFWNCSFIIPSLLC